MKKFLSYILFLLGIGLAGFSISQGWVGFFLEIAGLTVKQAGYEIVQGQVAIGGLVIALALFFIKPKLTLVGGLLTSICALWVIVSPPMVDDMQYAPEKMVYLAAVGGLLVSLGGFLMPAKAKDPLQSF